MNLISARKEVQITTFILLIALLIAIGLSAVSAQNSFPSSGNDATLTASTETLPSQSSNAFEFYIYKSAAPATVSKQASFKKNAPNPFSDQTVVSFFIPQQVQSAYISVTDMNGHVLKYFELHDRGDGQITIHGNELKAGTYRCSLIVDGKIVDIKQWVLIR